jgi:drug/metabolite transporter (DMT)-like permease
MEGGMHIYAIAFVFAGAFAFALYNMLSRYFQRGVWQDKSALITATSLLTASLLLFAFSLSSGGPQLAEGWIFPVLATGLLNIGIMYAKTRARALEEVSLVTPIDSTTPAVVILVAMFILGEYPTTVGWLGVWVLAIGTYVLNIQELRQKLMEYTANPSWKNHLLAWLAPFMALRRSVGVRWAFFAVGLSTLSLNYDGLVARRTDIGFGFGLVCGIAGLGNLTIVLARREYRAVKISEAVLRMIALGTLFAVGVFLSSMAFRYSLVAYVGAMKRVVIPMTIILAYVFLHERKSFRQRVAGGIVMAIGAVLIVMS